MRIATPPSRALEIAGALALALTLAVWSGACRPPLPVPPDRPVDGGSDAAPGADAGPAIQIDPDVDGGAPTVARFRVRVTSAAAAPPMLFQGELDSYYLGRIRRGELPSTLLARQVPALVWPEPGSWVIAPGVPLTDGETYSLASQSDGLVGTVTVADDGAPLLARVWPPPEGGGQTAVYCGEDGVAPRERADVVLDPGGIPASLTPGLAQMGFAEGRCVTLRVGPGAGPDARVPPVRAGGVALDPAPLAGAPSPVAPRVTCQGGEVAFGPGCATVEDDRLLVRSPDDARLWGVASDTISLVENVAPGARFVVKGFTPGTAARVLVVAVDTAGGIERGVLDIQTAPPQRHVAVSEVMANPVGAEPQQEWVELVNDGAGSVDLGGWVLADSAGETSLPSLVLAAGSYALVVRDDFVRDDGADVEVPADVPLLPVAELGKNGLANSGEMLELRAPDGSVVSRFPALKAAKGGVSMARRDPSSPDDDPSAFGPHADPGASPGAPNTLE